MNTLSIGKTGEMHEVRPFCAQSWTDMFKMMIGLFFLSETDCDVLHVFFRIKVLPEVMQKTQGGFTATQPSHIMGIMAIASPDLQTEFSET